MQVIDRHPCEFQLLAPANLVFRHRAKQFRHVGALGVLAARWCVGDHEPQGTFVRYHPLVTNVDVWRLLLLDHTCVLCFVVRASGRCDGNLCPRNSPASAVNLGDHDGGARKFAIAVGMEAKSVSTTHTPTLIALPPPTNCYDTQQQYLGLPVTLSVTTSTSGSAMAALPSAAALSARLAARSCLSLR